ncbi:hypothetical protein B0J11DRAFT_587850 [Dendryphion nanum]|uniref:Uncharacterized protein n=1 Tax=Dendryphion nanum TaxID=256645 RepID=A0A9P9EHS7_9PLEO|nr:hypothetical protein B0J11DRAFT_587850 [Dendryphion nanum]
MSPGETTACASCSMYLHGLNGVAKHLAQRFALLIVAKVDISSICACARKRNWFDLRFLSSASNSFSRDMGIERPAWMRNMVQGEDGGRFWYQSTPHSGQAKGNGNEVLRGVGLLTLVWNLLDVAPEGRGEWEVRMWGMWRKIVAIPSN